MSETGPLLEAPPAPFFFGCCLGARGRCPRDHLARRVLPLSLAMGITDSIERLRAGMDYHLARHNLLTANLAHVDTPGYMPLDLAQRATFDGTLNAAMSTTDPAHIADEDGPSATWEVVQDPTATPGADGNGVQLDREAVKIASNNLRYDALATMISNQLASMSWAANDGKSV